MTKKPKLQGGVAGARAHFLDALEEVGEGRDTVDPDKNLARDGIRPGQWPGAPHDAMPPKCPVTVLGMKGEVVYCVGATGGLHEISRFDYPTLLKLFSPYINYLHWAWPAFGKAEADPETGEALPPKVKRVERDKAWEAIISEAGRRGIFDPQDNVRGRGGWKDGEQFIWHSGRHIWTVQTKQKDGKAADWNLQRAPTGEYGGMYYRQDSDILQPWKSPIGWRDSPAHQLLQDFGTWNWHRPSLDPLFLLGWIGSSLMGAALKTRPIIFITGGRGTGKSTLHDIIKAIFGQTLYATANTTAAGIYQNLGQDSRPVAIDEFEAKASGFKEQAIIELARQAYSGAKLYRGGANHEGVEFELRSAFMFSAIMHPPLAVQDKSRMAILQLKTLENDGKGEPVVSDVAGRMLLRQIMDGWHDFDMHVLPRWRRLLHEAGFDARQIDTYGTLLATAELLVGEQGMIDIGFPADDPEHAIDLLKQATAIERSEQTEKWQDVISRVLEHMPEVWKRGEKQSIHDIIMSVRAGGELMTLDDARQALGNAGVGLTQPGKLFEGYGLAVPVNDTRVARIFEGTDYQSGGWNQALKQAPDYIVTKTTPLVKISREPKRCIVVDFEAYQTAIVGGADVLE
ncbi:hypothetical protein [Agrobacterium vitis]|uniref:hypothetical protein n=1 Tax=Agrobacterium vitis TaxID=373 RepID=UPI0015745607|nr:hypothetical protein [Agrobacterium vitis]NSY12409.1 hypothetical protein [Agrobacterium vitis]NSY22238.1 hypothetical protein [Agrobacterium vitis]NTA21939.1 hypothetical protein [Agrobacterium vitis]WEO70236.1 hypothetical protein G6L01_009430 [Agrobacterium vitis]